MKMKELFRKRKIILSLSTALIGVFLAVRYAEECRRGIGSGIGFCLEVLIPSLFFFMIVAAYIVQSGIAALLCRPLERISQALFRLPAQSAAVILLAMIGGYPVGASCASILAKEGRLSPSQAAKTVYIAVAAGPGFLLNFIGRTLLNNPQAGTILLWSQVIAVILTGVIVGHTVKSEPLSHSPRHPEEVGRNLLVRAVRNASGAAFGMCAMVVMFCALTEVMDTVIPDRGVCDIASAILEITNGCSRTCGRTPLYLTAFFVGFGGLSVHFQIFSAVGELPVKKGLFFLFRITEGIIAMAAAYIYLMFTPTTITVFSSLSTTPTAAKSATLAGSAALVLSSLLFIGSIAKKTVLTQDRHHDTEV